LDLFASLFYSSTINLLKRMAHETTLDKKHSTEEDLWSGGQEPFKASYGKLMMWYFLLSDAFTFAGFLIAYGALRVSTATWPVPDFVFQTLPGGITGAPLIFVTIMTFVLIVSSVTMVRAVQEGHQENKRGVAKWMLLTIIGGSIFLGCQAWEWTNLIGGEGMSIYVNPFSAHTEEGQYLTVDELANEAKTNQWETEKLGETTFYINKATGEKFFEKVDHHGHSFAGEKISVKQPYLITYDHSTHDYKPGAFYSKDQDGNKVVKAEAFGPSSFGAIFFFITGFHGFHVLSGLVILSIVLMNVTSGIYVERKNGYEMVEKVGLYWHFVDLVWVFVFLVFYLI